MQTYIVEVLNERAVSLLRDLENMDIIRLIPQEPTLTPAKQPRQELSEQLWRCISPETATDLHRQLNEMRNK